MFVYACGYNGFNQLDFPQLKCSFFCGKNSDDSNFEQYHDHPILIISSEKEEFQELDIKFTWSRSAVSFKLEDEKHITFVTRSPTSTKNQSVIALENMFCTASLEGSFLLREKDKDDTIEILQDEKVKSLVVSVSNHGDQSRAMLQHISGGHKDFFTIYDKVSFGKFRLSNTDGSSTSAEKVGDEKYTSKFSDSELIIQHIDFVPPVKEISCGKEHVLILSQSGNIYSYGLSSRGQLGHGDIEKEGSPRLIDALDGLVMKSISAGGWHSVGVSNIGDMYVWGWNESGQLGLASKQKEEDISGKEQDENLGIVASPICVDVPGDENIKDIACGSRHTVVLTEKGTILTCGWNRYGQLGLRDTISRNKLTTVDGFTGIQVFAGEWNSAFVCKPD